MSQPISVQDKVSTKLGKIASQGWKKFFPN